MTVPKASTVVIVGAGPAGIRAAGVLVAAGIRPVVLDEGQRVGGRIYRRPPQGFMRPPELLYGPDAGKACALHVLFDTMVAEGRVDYHPLSSAVAVADGALYAMTPGGRRTFAYDRLILATGATDRLAPVPGWQSAGVYSLGAAQIALKAQGVALGRKIVLAGSGPLLTLVASQLRKAGAKVAAVLDTAPLSAQVLALPGMLARPGLVLRGLRMRLRLGRCYHAGVMLDGIDCNERGPVSIRWRDMRGRSRVTACDMVGLGWHLRGEMQLAGLAGCAFDYDEGWAQWLPRTDRLGRAAEGLYLAGDGVRILGADGAELTGRLAATACLSDMGLPAPDVTPDLCRLARYERFARALARAFPWPDAMLRTVPDETIVCRCEGITAGEVRETAACSGAEANRVKSLARIGMGRCQGRYCQLAGAELIAARAGIAVCAAGRLREQAPVRPVLIGAWIGEG
ncbi:FAD/NAD(P)-binding oxidoreductase [Phyllobacterium phragmitis]|uniref:FAD/NAD(P)-binding oxidoreductase n=1 Tax=Phyllobacterium phragmitis TaxID=2670329 RepID=A0A2S9IRT3_9HYPH|nr:FAD/NAD(P)-binding oxidoreductase [Phyllobacterium phragmitis]PRD43225.1 FAD/NAD(P)-binding oxidoreductase [Phyllobacterium phragmitis]